MKKRTDTAVSPSFFVTSQIKIYMAFMEFKIVSPYQPTGDQPEAIEELSRGVLDGLSAQTLLGVTGSGKTFTMANVIEKVQKPTLILSHNKTLAAQLYGEFKSFFPDNAVEYFVSYYDYYQPEAYIPTTDTYIRKRFGNQRRNRPTQAFNDISFIIRPQRRYRRIFGFMSLRYRQPGRFS